MDQLPAGHERPEDLTGDEGPLGRLLRRAACQDPGRGFVRNKAVYVALALDSNGNMEVLGLWIEQTEGVKV